MTGLDGSGLVLREVISDSTVSPVADGAFTFSSAVFDGASYDVRVQNQPNDPAQTCSISNGAGTIAGGDVTNIVVTCTTVPSNGALDPAFGVTGRVSNLLPPELTSRSAAAAAAIEEAHPGFPGNWCELAAELHSVAGRPGAAAQLLLISGRRALRQGAIGSAIEIGRAHV